VAVTTVALALPQVAWAGAGPATLFNGLDGYYGVKHSFIGPGLGFYQPSDCESNPACLGPDIDVAAQPAYVYGHDRRAITIGGGPYGTLQREHLVVLRNPWRVINANQGRIDAWVRVSADPVPYSYGIYRIFGGPYGLGENFGLWVDADPTAGRLHFTAGLTYPATSVEARSVSTGLRGVDISRFNGSWIHVQAEWNRSGILGSNETLRLFVNGAKWASATRAGWNSYLGPAVDIGGGNDDGIARKFAVDDLTLYNTSS
jgi:Concanavalin A-like lectin/glucanases superfamily